MTCRRSSGNYNSLSVSSKPHNRCVRNLGERSVPVQSIRVVPGTKERALTGAEKTVEDFVESLVAHGVSVTTTSYDTFRGRVLGKFHVRTHIVRRNAILVLPLMGLQRGRAYEASLHGRLILYCWDVWEHQLTLWAEVIRAVRPVLVVITSRDSAEVLGQQTPNIPVHYLPEAVIAERFDSTKPLANRRIDVLELGRRSHTWHEAVAKILSERGMSHLYEEPVHHWVFPDVVAMRAGLADSKISVCFPSSQTHPSRSGTTETMTQRYLESMMSGSLVLGHAPKEMIDLFGFNPVLEVDWVDPLGQLLHVLTHIDSFQQFADRAETRARELGAWDRRICEFLILINRYAPEAAFEI
jgi:hypothetical protein